MAHVYLLHFDKKVANHAQHYLGYTPNGVEQRLATHLSGNGAKLVKAAVEDGCQIEVAKVWEHKDWREAREHERQLKRQHNGPRFCPVCHGCGPELGGIR